MLRKTVAPRPLAAVQSRLRTLCGRLQSRNHALAAGQLPAAKAADFGPRRHRAGATTSALPVIEKKLRDRYRSAAAQLPGSFDLGEPGSRIRGWGAMSRRHFSRKRRRWRPRSRARGAGAGPRTECPARRAPRGRARGRCGRGVGIRAGEDEGGEPAEGRHAGRPALRHLMGDEAVAVVGDQGPDHRIARDRRSAAAPGPARSARPARPATWCSS